MPQSVLFVRITRQHRSVLWRTSGNLVGEPKFGMQISAQLASGEAPSFSLFIDYDSSLPMVDLQWFCLELRFAELRKYRLAKQAIMLYFTKGFVM